MTGDLISRADALAVAMHSKDPVEGIKNLPVVKVVRCKDCDKGEPSNAWDGWIFCKANKIHQKDDNFCSYGERKE